MPRSRWLSPAAGAAAEQGAAIGKKVAHWERSLISGASADRSGPGKAAARFSSAPPQRRSREQHAKVAQPPTVTRYAATVWPFSVAAYRKTKCPSCNRPPTVPSAVPSDAIAVAVRARPELHAAGGSTRDVGVGADRLAYGHARCIALDDHVVHARRKRDAVEGALERSREQVVRGSPREEAAGRDVVAADASSRSRAVFATTARSPNVLSFTSGARLR